MKILLYLCLALFTCNVSFSEQIKILFPNDNDTFCSDNVIEIKCEGLSDKINLEFKSSDNDYFTKIQNFSISGNSIFWLPTIQECFDKPITLRVIESENPLNYDDVENIIIYSKTNIISQSGSITICQNQDCELKIDALGYNLTYQWYKDGIILDRERSNVLSFSNISYSQSGVYTCKIMTEGSCDETFSNPIPVYVATKTDFVQKPNDVQYSVYEALKEEKTTGRMSAKIHVNNIEDLKNIKFQWWKDSIMLQPYENGGGYGWLWPYSIKFKVQDDARITGSTSQTLQIRDMVWGDRANYYCVATGLCGSDTTRCYVGENTRFTIKNNFVLYDGCEGEDLTLKVTVKKFYYGKLLYKWCKAGNVKLEEGEKFIGTQTPELTIKNVDADKDRNVYYCQVTLVEYNLTQHSNEFLVEPYKLPKIAYQPESTVIKDRTNEYYGQTYVNVIVENQVGCLYTWFRNGKQARKICWKSDYWLGIDSCPPIDKLPPKRPSVPEDVGWYRCKIENKCGVIWSDSVYVSWGYDDIAGCVDGDATVSVEELDDSYYYEWTKNNKIIPESSKYSNTESHALTIKNLDFDDEGFYHCYAVLKSNNSKFEYGKIFLEISEPPIILKEFPDSIGNDGLNMRYVAVTASSKGKRFYYRLYIDDEPAEPLKEIINKNHWATSYPFYLGGYNSNLKTGRYKYYFKNDCGEIWSKEMKIINTAYIPGGTPAPEDSLISDVAFDSDIQNVHVFPNPASDYITIQYSNKELKLFAEGHKVQIFDVLGIEIMSVETRHAVSLQRINVSHLPAGVYFMRFGNKMEKFVKM